MITKCGNALFLREEEKVSQGLQGVPPLSYPRKFVSFFVCVISFSKELSYRKLISLFHLSNASFFFSFHVWKRFTWHDFLSRVKFHFKIGNE